LPHFAEKFLRAAKIYPETSRRLGDYCGMMNEPRSTGTVDNVLPLIFALVPFVAMVSACVVLR